MAVSASEWIASDSMAADPVQAAAVNLAVALQVMGHSTSLVDGNISFGSLDVFLNLEHNRSMLQLVGDVELVNSETVQEALVEHRTGLQVLLAPSRPEEADGIRGEHMQRILARYFLNASSCSHTRRLVV